jgi:hypothetical protein
VELSVDDHKETCKEENDHMEFDIKGKSLDENCNKHMKNESDKSLGDNLCQTQMDNQRVDKLEEIKSADNIASEFIIIK